MLTKVKDNASSHRKEFQAAWAEIRVGQEGGSLCSILQFSDHINYSPTPCQPPGGPATQESLQQAIIDYAPCAEWC